MAADSISSLILFIAAMLIAAGVAGTLVTNVNQISNSVDTYSTDVRDQIDTDIEIISDAGSGTVYDGNGTVTLYVKNTGDRTLENDTARLDVLVDGQYIPRSDLDLSVLEGGSWRSGTVAQLEIATELEAGEHRIVVGVDGDSEAFEFYTP
ncbi:archaellum stator protein ArlG [Natronobiforma cellulositropha]|uniref:flagellar protein G n=1 Tax=Natronobiforma cellulositropha TaxID=1679076 RepID=UPI0021D5B94E|nr:flagellar protein G [Natronobiforma cellulositropha]